MAGRRPGLRNGGKGRKEVVSRDDRRGKRVMDAGQLELDTRCDDGGRGRKPWKERGRGKRDGGVGLLESIRLLGGGAIVAVQSGVGGVVDPAISSSARSYDVGFSLLLGL